MPNFINTRSKPTKSTNLKNTQKQTHPTKTQEHPFSKLLRMLLNFNSLTQEMNMGLLLFITTTKPITRNWVNTKIRSGWIEWQVNSSTKITLSIVAAFKRLSSTSHWARESWTIDSLWDAWSIISGGLMVVIYMTHVYIVVVLVYVMLCFNEIL